MVLAGGEGEWGGYAFQYGARSGITHRTPPRGSGTVALVAWDQVHVCVVDGLARCAPAFTPTLNDFAWCSASSSPRSSHKSSPISFLLLPA